MSAGPSNGVYSATGVNGNPNNVPEQPVTISAEDTLGRGRSSGQSELGDSSVTNARKLEPASEPGHDGSEQGPSKRLKIEEPRSEPVPRPLERGKGVAPIKKEYLLEASKRTVPAQSGPEGNVGSDHRDDDARESKGKSKRQKANKGQNTKRDFGNSRDEVKLCTSRTRVNEFTPQTCRFGERCKFEHDIRRYLKVGKREDLKTFGGKCPIFEARGKCSAGWKCRFAGSHSEERETVDGRKELVLLPYKPDGSSPADDVKEGDGDDEDSESANEIFNIVRNDTKILLRKRQIETPKTEPYNDWLNKMARESEGSDRTKRNHNDDDHKDEPTDENGDSTNKQEIRAMYTSPPFLPSEKRRLYYGPETPILAPLTTQGNLPYRQLCVSLGAEITWSEMAMSLPLIQGDKGEWALMKAHASELTPPAHRPDTPVDGYDSGTDMKFGAQIAGNKPWLTLKATEILTTLCPSLRAIDLNCGCPIDLVFRQGAGSALLDTPGKLEKILRGMNAVSGAVPITAKIRMGTRDNKPMADKLVSRLAFGGPEARIYDQGPCGVAALTLHGRSRQQRYTRRADWNYIAECAAVVKSYRDESQSITDTVREPDERYLPNGNNGNVYFIGNGDVYSHEDYYAHIRDAKVDGVMVARGALIKPWIFEEITANQHLDKSASERLAYVDTFVRNGLSTWGSDEIGVGLTRRFLLEWLSFACRYVPVGLLEVLPPNIQDRPPAFRGRNELETLLSSDNYKDWITISEMFLGPAHKDFRFAPKHKSNSYEIEAEG